MKVSWQDVSTGIQTLVAIAIVAFVCWQTHSEVASYEQTITDDLEANIHLVDPPMVDSLPVASKRRRKMRYVFEQSEYGYGAARAKSSKGSSKGGKGGKGSKMKKEGDCPIELSVDIGPFVSTPSNVQCDSTITSVKLMYTGESCEDGGFNCQDNTNGDRPLVNCQEFFDSLPFQVTLVAYDDDGTVFVNMPVVQGQIFTISNGGQPLDRVNVETYIDGVGLAQVYSFQTQCDLFRFGCFSGFGSGHVVGWTSTNQGTFNCPLGFGTRSVEYLVDFSSADPTIDQTFDLVYAEFAAIAPTPEVTPIEELEGRIDPATNPGYTIGGFTAFITPTTNTSSVFTVLGLTVPERDFCEASLPYEIGGPPLMRPWEGLCEI